MNETKKESFVKRFFSMNGAAVLVATIALIFLFEIILQLTRSNTGGLIFMTADNLMSILRKQVYVGIIAFGLTLVMITGNIDLSVGNMLTFLCCIAAIIVMKTDNAFLGIVGTILLGGVCGLLNGVLVSYMKLNSFITTLGTSSIFSALALIVSAGTVLVIPNDCTAAFSFVGTFSLGPIHILIIWFVLVAVLLGLVLSKTVYGQQLYMIGANPIAARVSGVPSKRNTPLAYVITGLTVGLAAVIMMANVKSSNPQSGSGKEMDIILAVVVGGVSVAGGKGSVWGTIIGVLFSGVLSSGFTALNMSTYLQWVVMGFILVAVLGMDVMNAKGVKLWKKK